MLTAHELDGMERPPRLVVANACLSSQVSQQVVGVNRPGEDGGSETRGNAGLVRPLLTNSSSGESPIISARRGRFPLTPLKNSQRSSIKPCLSPGGKIGPAVCKARAALYSAAKVGRGLGRLPTLR